jgi:glutamine phosphoribosylpyrophosphate amidotransferase
MCGIIGFYSKSVVDKDLNILKKVLIESRIRGKHASGLAWFNGKSISAIVEPIPIDELAEKTSLGNLMYEKGKMSLIGHARYSTSDIRFNQPLVGKNIAIAHNGVITQVDPERWKDLYGYTCDTSNDSELLLQSMEKYRTIHSIQKNFGEILKEFDGSSIASVVLDNKGDIIGLRNSIRPLWRGTIGKGIVYASTFDILNRAGVSSIERIPSQSPHDLQLRSNHG